MLEFERLTATLLLLYSTIQTGTHLSFVFVVIYDFCNQIYYIGWQWGIKSN
jgi:hypothetical protein